MPSYRYTRDIAPEDLRPDSTPQQTAKEKRKNWWHYHWKLLTAGALIAVLAVGFAVDVIFKAKPDITIGVLSPVALPSELQNKLSQELAGHVPDINGDGRVVVDIEVFAMQTSDGQDDSEGDEDAYTVMASTTRLMAAMSTGEPALYLVWQEALPEYQGNYQLFGRLDGTLMQEGDNLLEQTVAWGDCAQLTEMDLQFETMDVELDGQESMSELRFALIPSPDSENHASSRWQSWQAAQDLLQQWAFGQTSGE